jgi:hypothetical protein
MSQTFVAGAAEIQIRASLDKLEADFDKAKAKSRKAANDTANAWDAGLSKINGSILRVRNQLLSFFAIKWFVGAVKDSLDAAAAIKDVANRAGVTTKYLQEMRFVALKTGSDFDTMDSALTRLNVNLGKFRNDGSGSAGKALRQLGLEAQFLQGEFHNTDAAAEAIFKALRGVKSDTDRAALAVSLFGREAGPKLAELMKTGEESVAGLVAEANKLGLVLTDEVIGKSDEAAEALDVLWETLKTAGINALASNAEAIRDLATAFAEAMPGIIAWLKEAAQWWGIIDRSPSEMVTRNLAATEEKLKQQQGYRDVAAKRGLPWGENSPGQVQLRQLEQDVIFLRSQLASEQGKNATDNVTRHGKSVADQFRWAADVQGKGGIVSYQRPPAASLPGQGAANFDPEAKGAEKLAEKLAKAADAFRDLATARKDWRADPELRGEAKASLEGASERNTERTVGADLAKLDENFQAAADRRAAIKDDIKYALMEGFRSGDWGSAFQTILQDRIAAAWEKAIDKIADLLAELFDKLFESIDFGDILGGGSGGGWFSDLIGSGSSGSSSWLSKAVGIVTGKGKAGGGGARKGGWDWVGEYGKELVNWDQDASVFSHDKSMDMIGDYSRGLAQDLSGGISASGVPGGGQSGSSRTFAPTINAPGADAAALQRVENELRRLDASIEGRAVRATKQAQMNGHFD